MRQLFRLRRSRLANVPARLLVHDVVQLPRRVQAGPVSQHLLLAGAHVPPKRAEEDEGRAANSTGWKSVKNRKGDLVSNTHGCYNQTQ